MHIQKDIGSTSILGEENEEVYEVPDKFCFKMIEFTVKNLGMIPTNVEIYDGDIPGGILQIEIYLANGSSVQITDIMRHFYDNVTVASTASKIEFSASGYLC